MDAIHSSGDQSLRLFQAQQAFRGDRAERAKSSQASDAIEGIGADFGDIIDSLDLSESVLQNDAPMSMATSSTPRRSLLDSQTLNEIQSVAEKAGFVGVNQRDIERAYLRGESLLADYRA